MRKSPQQAAYDWTFKTSKNKGYDTYTHLPMESDNAAYPFVVCRNSTIAHSHTKSDLGGTITQTLDVWGTGAMQVSNIADDLMHSAATAFDAYGYRFSGALWHHTCDIETDDMSVPNTTLYHALVSLIFEIM